MTPTHGFPVNDIDEHSTWMRRLARALVGEAAADDVVQDAWTQLGPRHERPGYLAAVVRSLSLRRLRSERQRKQRECRVKNSELPSTADIAARSEIVRRLAAAVDNLDEPYRQTIVLRYYDEMSSADIARRAGISAATVRARLKRGLDQLRARLDRDGGGRERWLGALLPWVRSVAPTPLKAGSVLAVFVAMKTLLSLVAIGVLVFAWMMFFDTNTPPAGAAMTAANPGVGALMQSPEADASAGANSERVLVATGTSVAVAEEDETPVSATIEARVVDARRYPLPFAWLRLVGGGRQSADADGRIQLELDPTEVDRLAALSYSRALKFRVGAPGCQTRSVRATLREGHSCLHLGDVVLEPGGAVHGRVVDETGRGVEGAVVAFGRPSSGIDNEEAMARRGPPDLVVALGESQNPAVTGTSGPGGQFHLAGVPVGYGLAWARTTTGLWTHSKPIGVRAGENVHSIKLVVRDARDRSITGRITDPEGRAVPDVELTWPVDGGWESGRTDALGRFHFAPKDARLRTLIAHTPTPEWLELRHEGIAIGTHNLVLVFQRATWLKVTVTDTDGNAICNGRVIGLFESGPVHRTLPRCRSGLDADGVARLPIPSTALRVLVAAPGYRDMIVGPLELDALPEPLAVRLERLPALTGRVLMPGGMPAQGAKVSLHRVPDKKRNITHQSWGADREAFVYRLPRQPAASVTADENGEFRLPLPGVDARSPEAKESAHRGLGGQTASNLPGAASWYVHAAMPNCATITSGPHKFDPPRDPELQLQLPAGGTIAGRLLLAPRMLPAGWTIYASDALGEVAEAAVDADGTFTLTDLHGGGWQVRAFEPGTRGPGLGGVMTKRVPKPDVQVEAGRTTDYEHDARPRLNARLIGRVRIDGMPPGPLVVTVTTVLNRGAATTIQRTLDLDGGFELAVQSGLRTLVSFVLPDDGGGLSISSKRMLADGVHRWNIDLNTTRIEGVFEPGVGSPADPYDLSYETRGIDWVAGRSWKGEPGRFGPIRVIAGPGALRGPPTDSVGPGPVLHEVNLEPGKTHHLGKLPR